MKKLFDYKINFIKRNPMLSVGISFFKGVLITLLILLPYLSFSQVSSWRSNPPTPQRSAPSIQHSTPQRNDVSRWRTQTEPIRPGHPIPNQPLVRRRRGAVGNPYGLMWGNWGWYQPYPYFWYDDFGYRNRGVVRIYENGKKDTVFHKKPVISFGVQKTGGNQIGGFFTIGNKSYFIAEYNSTFERDNSTFFQYGNITQVDFPLVNDLVEQRSFYVGVGKRIKRTGIHMMIGSVTEDVKWRGKDDIGYITFPKYRDRFTSVKIGALHDFKNLTIKFDYDPIIDRNTFGLGINF